MNFSISLRSDSLGSDFDIIRLVRNVQVEMLQFPVVSNVSKFKTCTPLHQTSKTGLFRLEETYIFVTNVLTLLLFTNKLRMP